MAKKLKNDNEKLYCQRVVSVRQAGKDRVETPVGKGWQQPKEAKKELDELKKKNPSDWLSIQSRA